MARIVLEAPMFDLKLEDGTFVPSAASMTDEERAALRVDVGGDFENAIRKAFSAMSVFDPAMRLLVKNGLTVMFEDAPAPAERPEERRVPLQADGKDQVCYKCRKRDGPLTFQARCYCPDCLPGGSKPAVSLVKA